MKKDLYRILSKLVALNTTAGNYKEIESAYKFIEQELDWYPFTINKYIKSGYTSMVWNTVSSLQPEIILCAHIDVVPADDNIFSIKKVKDNLYGRGVMDMKFAISVFIVALKTLYLNTGKLPSLAIMITSDEEIGGYNGVNYLVNEIGYSSKVVVIPDGGSNWQIVETAKGAIHLEVTTHGKSAHASEPWKGDSANDILIKKLLQLRALFPESGTPTNQTTLNVGKIIGGQQTNQVSDLALATLDIRHPSSESSTSIIDKITDIFNKENVRVLVKADPFSCDLKNSYVNCWINLLKHHNSTNISVNENGASDGRYFSKLNIPVIVSQPIGGGTHSSHEWIDENSVVLYTKLLINWLEAYISPC